MKRAVSLIHRQAVKAKAEGLYFNVSITPLSENVYTYVNRSQL
jgi:replication fork protection complex subunit Tof1/Swi1